MCLGVKRHLASGHEISRLQHGLPCCNLYSTYSRPLLAVSSGDLQQVRLGHGLCPTFVNQGTLRILFFSPQKNKRECPQKMLKIHTRICAFSAVCEQMVPTSTLLVQEPQKSGKLSFVWLLQLFVGLYVRLQWSVVPI